MCLLESIGDNGARVWRHGFLSWHREHSEWQLLGIVRPASFLMRTPASWLQFSPSPIHLLHQRVSKCGPQTSSISTTWDLARNANSWAPLWTYRIMNSRVGSASLFLKPLQMMLLHASPGELLVHMDSLQRKLKLLAQLKRPSCS